MNTLFQPTANCQLTNCLTKGVHPNLASSTIRPPFTRIQLIPNRLFSGCTLHANSGQKRILS
jgi:hypothetical protein